MNQIGIDISNDVFDVSLHRGDKLVRRQFTNRPSGHQQFMRWACQQAPISRVCMEATGIYHLQLALEMERHSQFQLMLINPWAARRFIQARMVRAKTDAIDADGLLQYLLQMPWRPWIAPKQEVLQLQSLSHRLSQLNKELSRERSRLHAARRAGSHTVAVQHDIEIHIQHLRERMASVKTQAIAVIDSHQTLAENAQLIDSAPGFAKLSAAKLLAELSVLPEDMSAPQWVAHAGLDPRPKRVGQHVVRPVRQDGFRSVRLDQRDLGN